MTRFLSAPEGDALRDRFDAVIARIEEAARASGRTSDSLRLIAVSKTHPAPMLAELFLHWRTRTPIFGENYVQEAVDKQKEVASLLVKHLRDTQRPLPEWHFIGHVQSRKAKDVAGRFALIHTVDSVKLARQIQKAVLASALPVQKILVQINIGDEAQKSGLDATEAEQCITEIMQIPQLSLEGLMCLPPWSDTAEASRPYFARMRELRDKLRQSTGLPLPHLSMGMSHDYAIAISEGATLVRIGTDIFGPRRQKT